MLSMLRNPPHSTPNCHPRWQSPCSRIFRFPAGPSVSASGGCVAPTDFPLRVNRSADPLRCSLGAAKIAYDFRAIDYKTLLEEREKSPAAYPLGQVPTLTFPDGRVVVQSGAILRWAGRKAGLYPREAERDDDALTIDGWLPRVPELGYRSSGS